MQARTNIAKSESPHRAQVGIVIGIALVALAAKIYCAATTFGSGDVTTICIFGKTIDAHGLDYLYRADHLFNHPPLAGAFFWWLYHVSSDISPTGICGVPTALPLLLRLPSVLADFMAVLILLKIHEKTGKPPLPFVMIFAASPAAFMVSAFHGNTDSVMVCLLLASAYFCVNENPILCGLFLALSCNVKIIPLLLTPVFFFFWLRRGNGAVLRFTLLFALFCLSGWSSALIGSPGQFYRNVLGYPSYAGAWGLTLVYSFISDHWHLAPRGTFPFANILWTLTALKAAIVGATIFLGWTRRKQDGIGLIKTITFCWLCFMSLTPGFMPYYLIWIAPFLVCESGPWYIIVTLATSAYLFAYYDITSRGIPWNFANLTLPPTWPVWGLLPWLALTAMAAAAGAKILRQSTLLPDPQQP
ncbi:MAG TPA: glycosyltransferase 87 family protein [Chthoniobacteraceae bacterium]|jgi:hypothetical protein|nr:glycosyltransferase 87 family protein [Chthoniobacteraceae bacterium]